MFSSTLSQSVCFIREHKTILIDSVSLICATALTGIILGYYEVTEWVFQFSREHEEFELDELILTAAIFAVYLLFFVFRRFYELKQLMLVSNCDPLIGITNRRRGDELLEQEVMRVNRHDYESAIILLDIDNFKSVNDTYGHPVGDAVLKELSHRVREQIRGGDSFVRWGGEEFLVLSHRATLEDAKTLAERLRSAIEKKPFAEVGRVTVSIGVSLLYKGTTAKKQIDLADQGLYTSKRLGKNQVTVVH